MDTGMNILIHAFNQLSISSPTKSGSLLTHSSLESILLKESKKFSCPGGTKGIAEVHSFLMAFSRNHRQEFQQMDAMTKFFSFQTVKTSVEYHINRYSLYSQSICKKLIFIYMFAIFSTNSEVSRIYKYPLVFKICNVLLLHFSQKDPFTKYILLAIAEVASSLECQLEIISHCHYRNLATYFTAMNDKMTKKAFHSFFYSCEEESYDFDFIQEVAVEIIFQLCKLELDAPLLCDEHITILTTISTKYPAVVCEALIKTIYTYKGDRVGLKSKIGRISKMCRLEQSIDAIEPQMDQQSTYSESKLKAAYMVEIWPYEFSSSKR